MLERVVMRFALLGTGFLGIGYPFLIRNQNRMVFGSMDWVPGTRTGYPELDSELGTRFLKNSVAAKYVTRYPVPINSTSYYLRVEHDLRCPVPPSGHVLGQEPCVVVIWVRHSRQTEITDLQLETERHQYLTEHPEVTIT